MVVVAVTDSNLRREDHEGTPTYTSIGGGPGAAADGQYPFQGTQAGARRINSTGVQVGYWTSVATTTDMTAAGDEVWMAKILIANPGVINPGGLRVRLGATTTNYYEYLIHDDGSQGIGQFAFPSKGGYIIIPLNPNLVAWRDFTTGSPALTAVDEFAVTADVSATTTGENLAIDAIDIGPGLFIVGGSSTDPDATWEDFITDDEGTITAGRFGHVTTQLSSAIIFLFGGFVIGRNSSGTNSETDFTDANRTITWGGGLVDAGWNFLEVDLTTSGTVVSFTAIVHNGIGRDDEKRYFDSELDVDVATDEIDLGPDHGFLAGDAVRYSDEGLTGLFSGLTDGTLYFLGDPIGDEMKVYATRQDAFTNTSPITLTPAGSGFGQINSFTREPSTLPDLTITATTGTFTSTGCTFNAFRQVTGTSAATFTNCVFRSCKNIDLVGATLTGCTVDSFLCSPGVAAVTSSADESENISDTVFTANSDIHLAGHAIEIDSAPTGDLAYSGITFTGYGPALQTFDPFTDVDVDADNRIDITGHPYTTGDPVYYLANDPADGTSWTPVSGLTSNTLYYVRSVSANEITLHESRRAAEDNSNVIAVTATISNEDHALYSGYAAVVNNTTSDITIAVSNGGTSPSYRNTTSGTVTITNAVTVRVESVTEGTAVKVVANEAAGTIAVGDTIFELLADSNGVAELTTFNYEAAFGAGLDVIVRCRQQGLPNAAIQSDNGVFTDFTTESNSTTVNDVQLFPATAVVNQDSFQFGHAEQFGQIKLDLSTVGAGGFGTTWEYWDGSAWSALSGVTDGSSDLTVANESTVSWTIPGDWATRTDNSQGPFYYVRVRYTSGTMSTNPLLRKAKLDVTRYLPFTQDRTIGSTGLTVVATWVEDTIASF